MAKPRAGCSLRTLRGSFGGVQTGTTATGSVAIETLRSFFGNGHATARVTLMTQAQGPVNFPASATYTLNRDRSGTLTARRLNTGQTVHFRITVTQSGRSMYLLETDPGAVVTGTFSEKRGNQLAVPVLEVVRPGTLGRVDLTVMALP